MIHPYCDCEKHELDCFGVCGGSAVKDVCGKCGGTGFPLGACNCNGDMMGCDN